MTHPLLVEGRTWGIIIMKGIMLSHLDSETRWRHVKFFLPSSVRWDPPYQNEVISSEKRALIASKLIAHFTNCITRVEVIDRDRRAEYMKVLKARHGGFIPYVDDP